MINSTTSTDRAVRTDLVATTGQKAPRTKVAAASDKLSTTSATRLQAALARQPEIRPEVVERARALAADPNYPSTDILRNVGSQILNSPDLSEDAS